MTRTSRLLIAVAATLLALPATASAATVTLSNGTATYTAASGEANHLSVDYDGSGNAYVAFEDTGVAQMTAGPGCSTQGAQKVRCLATSVAALVFDMGDGNDWLGVGVGLRPSTVYGGLGNDTIFSGFGNDTVDAGAGNDTIDGTWGDDVVDGGDGADAINTAYGTGRDSVTYAGRTAAVSVTLDGVANDGAAGEGDNVSAGVDDITGGAGNDSLTGNDGANTIIGGLGNDTLGGAGGDDLLDGAGGVDSYSGGAGIDVLKARDGAQESLACGTEADVADADHNDNADADCEVVNRDEAPPAPPAPPVVEPVLPPAPSGGTGNVIEPPVATIATTPIAVSAAGVAPVRVKCPSEAFEGCAGTILMEVLDVAGKGKLDVQSARRRKTKTKLASRRFKVAAGQGKTVPVRLDRRVWRKFKKKKRVKVQITVTMENATGTTTNTQTIELRPAKPKR
jgi:Ca2+-binding RTX toxin-like protein